MHKNFGFGFSDAVSFCDRGVKAFGLLLLASGIVLTGCSRSETRKPVEQSADAQGTASRLDAVDRSEAVLGQLRPILKQFVDDFYGLQLPDQPSHQFFAGKVAVTPLVPRVPTAAESFDTIGVERRGWTTAGKRTVDRSQLRVWSEFLAQVDYAEQVRFYPVDGQYAGDDQDFYEAHIGFDAVVRLKSGRAAEATAHCTLRLSPTQSEEGPWEICEWTTDDFTLSDASRFLFADVLDERVPDGRLQDRLRGESHAKYVVQAIREPDTFSPPHPAFSIISWDRHPGLAVVDLDRDGRDDLYVMDRWGKNVLLHNGVDGRFTDVAPLVGLDLEDHCSCAAFADFDNDGDTDVFVGRTLERSIYLTNEDGQFEDRSSTHFGEPLPHFVTALSVVDFDADGLLDVYVCTYADHFLRQALGEENPHLDLYDYLPQEAARELLRLLKSDDYHDILNTFGPPNELYKNLGKGRFQRVTDSPLSVYRNTYQASWCDYDGDGDSDVYLSNDFSANLLFRNDGKGEFSDVTAETQTADHGFGMGASWGDYDNDGRPDLYTSNMYSKAGTRLAKKLDGLPFDQRLVKAWRGNSLFKNCGAPFKSMTDEGFLPIEHVGWSWGSQFADVDNDGWLDIYAMSGYYTAPQRVAAADDL